MHTKGFPLQVAPTAERRMDNTESHSEYINHQKGQRPPKLAELPIALQTLLAPMPKEFSIQTLIVALAVLGVYMPRLRFKYTYDVRLHVPVVQVLIEAPQSGNKSVIDFLVGRIIRLLRRRDKGYRRIEQDYKDKRRTECNAQGSDR